MATKQCGHEMRDQDLILALQRICQDYGNGFNGTHGSAQSVKRAVLEKFGLEVRVVGSKRPRDGYNVLPPVVFDVTVYDRDGNERFRRTY